MLIIYCYGAYERRFAIWQGYSVWWNYLRSRPMVSLELRASESVWIVPGTLDFS